jgi:sarcosine oxidase
VFARTVVALERQAIEHHVLDPAAVARRFPPVRTPDGTLACHMPAAGFLDADRCVAALLQAACAAGAEILPPTSVQGLDLGAELPLVIAPERAWRCERLVIAPGPWALELLADCAWPLQPTRQYTWYFAPQPSGRCGPERIPVLGDRVTGVYSFPEHAGGIKVALDHPGPPTSPDEVQPPPAPEHVGMLRTWLNGILPGSSLRSVGGETCFYTMTPDRDFVIGRHPRHERAVVAAGFSGHGFKFGAVVGRILAELTEGRTALPIERFDPNRFGQAESSGYPGTRG